jgi:hypothetical protein
MQAKLGWVRLSGQGEGAKRARSSATLLGRHAQRGMAGEGSSDSGSVSLRITGEDGRGESEPGSRIVNFAGGSIPIGVYTTGKVSDYPPRGDRHP